MTQIPKQHVLTEAVNDLLGDNELPAAVTLEECAAALAMSTTSFRRKLGQEGTSFKLIHQKFLNELCVTVLSTQQVKIDDLATRLGYSERATFERAFKQKFGLSPSQFRNLAAIGKDKDGAQELKVIAQSIPPMSDSCRALMQAKSQDKLDIDQVLSIVQKDPIFCGRIMGQASKAIYGKTPIDLKEAILRNLGISTVVNFAVIFGMQDALSEQVSPKLIKKYSDAFLMAPTLFKLIRRSIESKVDFDTALVEQVLVFGLLGLFLLTHKHSSQQENVLHSLRGIDDLYLLNNHIKQSTQSSIYLVSALMLSQWHIDANVIKWLSDIDKLNDSTYEHNGEQSIVLFMLSCLYRLAAGHEIDESVVEKAHSLGIYDIEQIFVILTG
ncbi:AraC family transcriptional regulator [Thalassotalea sp. M1531]|uniref:AraC family transcriptional regulator n=1 Tax=Thalassotalea algicola TaxID=2716224 RepID=A0A7Y0Q6G9_9GAMM|nr:helix-turn-helix domain-containing protein [Thalassotalea algicola]NMP29945.1 AraC family transcriptional regulator [Thalassotalea algicola]